MGSLKTFKTLVKENKAPRGAKYIGVFKKGDGEDRLIKKINIAHTNLENDKDDSPIFRFGVLSDVHINAVGNNGTSKERRCECKYDFLNALNYFKKEGAEFVCISGDMVLGGNSSGGNNGIADWELVKKIIISGSTDIPVFACMGNHDTYSEIGKSSGYNNHFFNLYQSIDANIDSISGVARPFGKTGGLGSNVLSSITEWVNEETGEVDDFGRADSKIMEWVNDYWKQDTFYANTFENVSDVTDQVVFQVFDGMSVDESETGNTVEFEEFPGEVIGINVLVEDNGTFKGMETKTTGSFFFEHNGYVFIFFSPYIKIDFESFKSGCERRYPNIEWLRRVLEHYRNQRCFVFIHPPFNRKAGNLWGDKNYGERNGEDIYNSDFILDRKWEYPDSWATQTTREFVRLNELNNHYKNAIWFFGHTHYKSLYQKFFRRANITDDDPQNEGTYTYVPSALNIHVPSCAYPRYIIDVDCNSNYITPGYENRKDDYDDSEGIIVDVYSDRFEIKSVWFKRGDDNSTADNIYNNSSVISDSDIPLPSDPDNSGYTLYINNISPIGFYSTDNTLLEIEADTGNTIFTTRAVTKYDVKETDIHIFVNNVDTYTSRTDFSGATVADIKNNMINKLTDKLATAVTYTKIVSAYTDNNNSRLNYDYDHKGDIRNNSMNLLEGCDPANDGNEVVIETITENLRKVPLELISYIVLKTLNE